MVADLADLEARESELMAIETEIENSITEFPEIDDIAAYGEEMSRVVKAAERREQQLLLREWVKGARMEMTADRVLVWEVVFYPLPGFDGVTHKVRG